MEEGDYYEAACALALNVDHRIVYRSYASRGLQWLFWDGYPLTKKGNAILPWQWTVDICEKVLSLHFTIADDISITDVMLHDDFKVYACALYGAVVHRLGLIGNSAEEYFDVHDDITYLRFNGINKITITRI